MTDSNLIERAEAWLVQCPPCDLGVGRPCVCPTGDVRTVIRDLVDEIITLRKQVTS